MTTSETEKEFKQQEHQRERANIRTALANIDDEGEVLPHPKQFGNPWAGPKDGRRYHGGTPYEKEAKKK